MASDNLLEVSNLTIAFKDGEQGLRTVVEDVSFHLGRGKTLGIVGESGSGKSVCTLALMGLLPKNARVSGKALLGVENGGRKEGDDSIDLLKLDEEGFRAIRGKRLSMIFQEPMTSLNPVQKCGAQVVEMLQQHERLSRQEARNRVIDLFKEVRLPRPEKIFDSYPHEISGGQKQRVMIAMALVNEPDIIIADEPTTALDVTVQKTILDLLRTLQNDHGISIIFITHDLGVIAQIADDILVLYRGKVVEQGAAYDILHHPEHPYTQGLLACRPPLEGRPRRLPTVNDFMLNEKTVVEKDDIITSPQNALNSLSGEQVPLLSVRNINVEYVLKKSFLGRPLQKLKAVDGISFDVYRGETLGLVGESGCGKSTLGRALLRLIDSRSDSITFDGQRLDTLSASEMRLLRPRIQIIFQDPYSSLNPRMTVGQIIMEPLRVHQRNIELCSSNCEKGTIPHSKFKNQNSILKSRVIDLMERVGLESGWFDRYPHQFSGGQRQRICIARALILNPELVICDESVSALDVSVQAQVLNLLGELKEQFGYTYIFISHDLSVVHYVSDRIMVMKAGQIIEHGNTDEVYHAPKEEYTRTLLGAIPKI